MGDADAFDAAYERHALWRKDLVAVFTTEVPYTNELPAVRDVRVGESNGVQPRIRKSTDQRRSVRGLMT